MRKEKHEAGGAGRGGRGEQKWHLNQTKPKPERVLVSAQDPSRRRGVQGPLAGHLLSLLLVPAHLGRVQLLWGQTGWAGACAAPHPQLAAAGTHLTLAWLQAGSGRRGRWWCRGKGPTRGRGSRGTSLAPSQSGSQPLPHTDALLLSEHVKVTAVRVPLRSRLRPSALRSQAAEGAH